MRIAEIYTSLQGEGLHTGTPSTFIRVSGCNLRCTFCDSPFTSWRAEGERMDVRSILAKVVSLSQVHVVITGGEPMLFPDLPELTEELTKRGHFITIETAGTVFAHVACQLMSISPKTSNSAPDAAAFPMWHARHERRRFAPQVLEQLVRAYDHQFKFVVQSPRDVDELESYLAACPFIRRARTYLMPEGTNVEQLARVSQWLEPMCREREFLYCPRKHIEWFGHTRGT